MAKNKTTYSSADVYEFIDTFANTEQKKKDSLELITLFQDITGETPRMWGPFIIGFGTYHYKYASGHEGDAPVLAFSPRKSAISLYIYSDTEKSQALLSQFGKFKQGRSCIYIHKLSDIDSTVFKELCHETIKYIDAHHECSCRKNNHYESLIIKV